MLRELPFSNSEVRPSAELVSALTPSLSIVCTPAASPMRGDSVLEPSRRLELDGLRGQRLSRRSVPKVHALGYCRRRRCRSLRGLRSAERAFWIARGVCHPDRPVPFCGFHLLRQVGVASPGFRRFRLRVHVAPHGGTSYPASLVSPSGLPNTPLLLYGDDGQELPKHFWKRLGLCHASRLPLVSRVCSEAEQRR